MQLTKEYKVISGIIFAAVVVFLFLANKPSPMDNNENEATFNSTCITKTETRGVKGNSMSGIVEKGENIKVLFGFYDCNEIIRGDIILYKFAGNKDPLIKIIKGLPGDLFELKRESGGWNIVVNGSVLLNSEGKAYLLTDKKSKMLELYVNDYKGIIPEKSYLILGNDYRGSVDSTQFGLIGLTDILGKAELTK